ncbi:LysR family transcriptional regulator [Hoeflea poritis]|uniref:LysR family transcriptional regulator n=1 Tax=Hoeflea poritis TaxID=2993659 RepID=A0ABT4VNY7_9HYPH|nr:LysR family transcriptional regulator [Hoeflea poritis]MDA4845865.1 LysR family transcriptional regulator [Hoeflea poritis]
MHPTHRQLEYLVAVTDTGHFGAAARRCNVTQPTLSAQIQLLEDRLHAKLLDRSPSGARPTPLGEIVVGLSRHALATIEEIENVTRKAADNLGGLIRLATLSTVGPYFLPYLLPRLSEDYPGLEVIIREERPQQLEQGLLAGTFDCALTRAPEEQGTLVFRELVSDPMWLGIPADHPLAAEPIIRPEMLTGQQMMTLGSEHGMPPSVRQFHDSIGAEVNHDYEGTTLDGLSQLVSTGKGMALLPRSYITSNLCDDNRIVFREVEGRTLTRSVGLAWRDGCVRSSQYEELFEQFNKTLEDMRGTL